MIEIKKMISSEPEKLYFSEHKEGPKMNWKIDHEGFLYEDYEDEE